MKLKDILNEKITIDVNIGDTILTGRFKNKKTKVNSIEKDQHGMPTINGRKVTTFRTLKKQDESTAAYKKTLQKILRDKQLKMLSKKDKETLLKIAKMMKEGPQRDRNNMALYIIDLNKELSNAKVLAKKHPKYKKYVKFIQQDIKDAEKKLAKIKESVKEDFDAVPAKWSSTEAKQMMDVDVKKMSNVLGKASYKIIKMMMDGVKSGKYDALDIIRGIETGALNRTHEGERPFMKMLWRKVRKEFRRYLPKGKLRR